MYFASTIITHRFNLATELLVAVVHEARDLESAPHDFAPCYCNAPIDGRGVAGHSFSSFFCTYKASRDWSFLAAVSASFTLAPCSVFIIFCCASGWHTVTSSFFHGFTIFRIWDLLPNLSLDLDSSGLA
jgi:hypothetical protein